MTNTRTVELDLSEDEFKRLLISLEALTLERIAIGLPAECAEIDELKAKIELAWVEAEFRDEDDAHNDWVNREMYGQDVEPDPGAVVRFIDGRNVVTRRRYVSWLRLAPRSQRVLSGLRGAN